MHLPLPTPTLLLALAIGTSSAASVIARQDLGTVAIIGTFTDTACRAGQTDYSQTALNHWGTCSNLPGNSMKIWWLAKGCTVLMFTERLCQANPDQNVQAVDTCFQTKHDLAWWVYCS